MAAANSGSAKARNVQAGSGSAKIVRGPSPDSRSQNITRDLASNSGSAKIQKPVQS